MNVQLEKAILKVVGNFTVSFSDIEGALTPRYLPGEIRTAVWRLASQNQLVIGPGYAVSQFPNKEEFSVSKAPPAEPDGTACFARVSITLAPDRDKLESEETHHPVFFVGGPSVASVRQFLHRTVNNICDVMEESQKGYKEVAFLLAQKD